jgi:hypothetical protein
VISTNIIPFAITRVLSYVSFKGRRRIALEGYCGLEVIHWHYGWYDEVGIGKLIVAIVS